MKITFSNVFLSLALLLSTNLGWSLDKSIDLPLYNAGADHLSAIQQKLGTSLVRIMITNDNAEDQSLTEYQAWWDEQKVYLASAIQAASSLDMRIIIEIHDPPLGNDKTVSPVQNKIFQAGNEAAKELFKNIWIEVAQLYNSNSTVAGYQLMNEPRAPKKIDWTTYSLELSDAIRGADSTPIASQPFIIFTARYGNTSKAKELTIPTDGGVYRVSASFYAPHNYTHQGISDDLEFGYPSCKSTSSITVSKKKKSKNKKKKNDKKKKKKAKKDKNKCSVKKTFTEPLKAFTTAVSKLGVEPMISEYSVVAYAPGGADYLQDLTNTFDKLNIHSNYHVWRGAIVWSLLHQGSGPNSLNEVSSTDRLEVINAYMNNGK